MCFFAKFWKTLKEVFGDAIAKLGFIRKVNIWILNKNFFISKFGPPDSYQGSMWHTHVNMVIRG